MLLSTHRALPSNLKIDKVQGLRADCIWPLVFFLLWKKLTIQFFYIVLTKLLITAIKSIDPEYFFRNIIIYYPHNIDWLNDIQSEVIVHSEACTGYFTSFISSPSHCYLAMCFHAFKFYIPHLFFTIFYFWYFSFIPLYFFPFFENNLTAITLFHSWQKQLQGPHRNIVECMNRFIVHKMMYEISNFIFFFKVKNSLMRQNTYFFFFVFYFFILFRMELFALRKNDFSFLSGRFQSHLFQISYILEGHLITIIANQSDPFLVK